MYVYTSLCLSVSLSLFLSFSLSLCLSVSLSLCLSVSLSLCLSVSLSSSYCCVSLPVTLLILHFFSVCVFLFPSPLQIIHSTLFLFFHPILNFSLFSWSRKEEPRTPSMVKWSWTKRRGRWSLSLFSLSFRWILFQSNFLQWIGIFWALNFDRCLHMKIKWKIISNSVETNIFCDINNNDNNFNIYFNTSRDYVNVLITKIFNKDVILGLGENRTQVLLHWSPHPLFP
jgi:hypothetical protein